MFTTSRLESARREKKEAAEAVRRAEAKVDRLAESLREAKADLVAAFSRQSYADNEFESARKERATLNREMTESASSNEGANR